MLTLDTRGILDPVPAPTGIVSLSIIDMSIFNDDELEASSSSAWSAVASGDWSNGSPSTPPSSGWSASATSTGQGQWGRPTATDAWAPASPSVSDWQSTSNGSFPTTPSSGYGGANSTVVVSATVTVTGLAPPVNTTRTVPDSSGNGSPGHWGAPHYVVYSDYWLHTMPDVSDLTDFNRFILAFWMSDRGAVDNAQMWEWTDTATRQKASVTFRLFTASPTDHPGSRFVSQCWNRLDGVGVWIDRFPCHSWCRPHRLRPTTRRVGQAIQPRRCRHRLGRYASDEHQQG